MIDYHEIHANELTTDLFTYFVRHQVVSAIWRQKGKRWLIEPCQMVETWSEVEHEQLVFYLEKTLSTHGVLFGAFIDNELKGFVSVEGTLFGQTSRYLDLSSLHVSEDKRGQGIGKALFKKASIWAKQKGADKLYISAHPAVATQAFYQKIGCVPATEIDQAHVDNEPGDRQLEYAL